MANSLNQLVPVRTYDDLRCHLVDRGWWVSIPITTFPANWLYDGEQRLDGGYYGADVFAALHIIKDSGLQIKELGGLCKEVFILGRFRRVYATDKEAGWPYLSASEALTFRPTSNRWIAKDHAPKKAKRHFARRGWILISSSGSVGRAVMATKRLERFFLTHDLVRVVPNESTRAGYLYAYLWSWAGQALLSKDQYGGAIKHLEPHHVAGVPVPLLPETIQEEIDSEIVRAYTLREEASALLDKADTLLHHELRLPQFSEELVPYLSPPTQQSPGQLEMPHPKAFAIKASEFTERIDASFHVPIARTAVSMLNNAKFQPVPLGEIAEDIFIPPRFKRIYVPEEYGVPFLQGSHLPQIKPYDIKYLSRMNTPDLERWIVRKGWVLVTCSGTIGRVHLVSSAHDQWAATQHILRVVPSQNKGHPGYIAAFLSTPYGLHQLTAKTYGAVVDELTDQDTREVLIPNAPPDIQNAIGELVVDAYEKKDEATDIEEKAISQLEDALTKSGTNQ